MPWMSCFTIRFIPWAPPQTCKSTHMKLHLLHGKKPPAMSGRSRIVNTPSQKLKGKQVTDKELLALADRVEKLEGGCRETDAEIASAIGVFSPDSTWTKTGPETWHKDFKSIGTWTECFQPKDYTSSIDAAMTLVPRSRTATSLILKPNGKYEAWLSNGKAGRYVLGYHASPTLAICAASLRAKAKGGE